MTLYTFDRLFIRFNPPFIRERLKKMNALPDTGPLVDSMWSGFYTTANKAACFLCICRGGFNSSSVRFWPIGEEMSGE